MFVAYADRRGVIGFCDELEEPEGVLTFAKHRDFDLLRAEVEVVARHAYRGDVLLVPGVPESPEDDAKAVNALIAWRDWAFGRFPIVAGTAVLS